LKTSALKNEVAFLRIALLSLFLAISFVALRLFDFQTFFRSANRPFHLIKEGEGEAALLPPSQSMPGATRLALGGKIDLNQASPQDLAALPEVGPSLAERIVMNRKEMGSFKRVEDLMRVKGIKQKKFDKIKPFIQVL